MTEAILPAGGQGARLRPVTVNTPKPMVPAAGVPFLAHQIARAAAAGVDRVVPATCHLAEAFERYFANGSAYGITLEFAVEGEPLGTGGAIRNEAGRLTCGGDEPVLVFNGDIRTGLDLRGLVATHRLVGADVTLHLVQADDSRAFGLVPTDVDDRVTAVTEKPQTPEQPQLPEEIVTDQINAGCYVFRRSVIDTIPAGRAVSVERETYPEPLADGARLHGKVENTYRLDLGRPEALVRAAADPVRGVIRSPAVPGWRGEALVLPGARVAEGAELADGTVAGAGAGAGAGARIGAGAVVRGSVVLDGAVVCADVYVHDSMIGAGVETGSRTRVLDAVVGDGARVEADNELGAGVRVWCDAVLSDGAPRFSSDRV